MNSEPVRILWVSRHNPLPIQLETLAKLFKHFTLKFFNDKVPSAEWLVENVVLSSKIDIVIPVLPLSIIARLVELSKKHNFQVWWAEMECVGLRDTPILDDPKREVVLPTIDRNGKPMYRVMRFKRFNKIKAIKLEMEPIKVVQ